MPNSYRHDSLEPHVYSTRPDPDRKAHSRLPKMLGEPAQSGMSTPSGLVTYSNPVYGDQLAPSATRDGNYDMPLGAHLPTPGTGAQAANRPAEPMYSQPKKEKQRTAKSQRQHYHSQPPALITRTENDLPTGYGVSWGQSIPHTLYAVPMALEDSGGHGDGGYTCASGDGDYDMPLGNLPASDC